MKNQLGVITHLPDYRKLLETIPNIIKGNRYIIGEVKIHQKNRIYYLEIVVPNWNYREIF